MIAAGVAATALMAEGEASLVRAALEKGDASRGANIFHQPHMACNKCHLFGDKENSLGPELTQFPEEHHECNWWIDLGSVKRDSSWLRIGNVVAAAMAGHVTGFIAGRARRTQSSFAIHAANGAKVVDSQLRRLTIRKNEPDIHHADRTGEPTGDRQQFLDLLRYLIEIRDGGTKRALELKPPASQTPLPIPKTRVRYLMRVTRRSTGQTVNRRSRRHGAH